MEPNRNGEHRRRRRLGWLWLLLALLLVAAGLGVGLGMRGGDDDGGSSNAGGGATTGVAGASKTLQGAGRLTSGSSNLLAWLRNSGRLAAVAGKPVTAPGGKGVSVVGDEVFWIGRSNADRILVHLETNGESGPTVRAGDHVSFLGTLARNGAGDAGMFGVKDSEGASLLKRQKVHVETQVSTLKLS